MYDDNRGFRSCPQCASDDFKRSIRAYATVFGCVSCHHTWMVRRMPSAAEANDTLNRWRGKPAEEGGSEGTGAQTAVPGDITS